MGNNNEKTAGKDNRAADKNTFGNGCITGQGGNSR